MTPTATDSSRKFLLPYLGRGLEGLWLSAVFLIPLVFLGQEYAISEAQIAYAEVPKVALLHTLAGLIAVLWSVEWAIASRAFQNSFPSVSMESFTRNLRPMAIISRLNDWVRVHPTRWLVLAASLFFGSTLLSTVLSGSFTTSMWGEIPGQDGYSAYTVASYGIIFAVIATHLKRQAQLRRLLSVVVLMGVLVGFYGSLQHYGHDFLGTTESTGGGAGRVTIFMGNAIFAGALLAMTVPLTLVAAAVNSQDENWGDWGPISRLGRLGRDSIFTFIWASFLAIQLNGLMFTFSRGPWSGAVLAMAVFLGLIVVSLGWRMLIRTGLVLGLAGILSVSFLHWQGNVSVVNVGTWLGFALALFGLAGTVVTLFIINNFGRTIIFLAVAGTAVAIIGAVVIAPSALSGRGTSDSTAESTADASISSEVSARIWSIKTDALAGFTGGRGTHWKVSWELIKDRPWPEFDNLHLSWLRPLIGYGPDLFRYTYLLRSPAEEGALGGFNPLEPDHAHNFFIHQTVEQGFLGGFASLAIFFSTFVVVAHQLLRRHRAGNPIYRLVLIGMMAIILGRFLEMMVGVARISDLTVLWVIFGLFAALANLDDADEVTATEANTNVDSEPTSRNAGRRDRNRSRTASTSQKLSNGLIIRFALVAWLIGVIGVVTWQKSVNYVLASVHEGRAIQSFRTGDLETAIDELDQAIRLAPGVPVYYTNRGSVFLAYQIRSDVGIEPACYGQDNNPYLTCLGLQNLQSNLEGASQQPFNFRAQVSAGNAAFNLQLHDIAIESYERAVALLPNAWGLRDDLAESQIDAGLFYEALAELDWGLDITGESRASARAWFLRARALTGLGQHEGAIASLELGIPFGFEMPWTQDSLNLTNELNAQLGVQYEIDYFDRKIRESPQDAIALYLRGRAKLRLGYPETARQDVTAAYTLGLVLPEVLAMRGYTNLKAGGPLYELDDLNQAVLVSPQNAFFQVFLAEKLVAQNNFVQAFRHLDDATILDSSLGLAHLIRAKIFLSLGLTESAKDALDATTKLEFPSASDYADRGEMHAFLGDFDLAIADLTKAIRISPDQSNYYNARAKAYAIFNDYTSALMDFTAAIQKDDTVAEYLINRGVAYDIIGKPRLSSADFETAISIGDVEIPSPSSRNALYFAVYTETPFGGLGAQRILKWQTELNASHDIDLYSGLSLGDRDYGFSLQKISEAYLELELWREAINSLSQLIKFSPTTAETYRYRGDAYLEVRMYEEAINDYAESVSLNGSDEENLVARGKGYSEIGEFHLAQNDYDEAIRLNSLSSNAYKHRGYLSVQLGDNSLAFSDIDRAIEISPQDHDAYFRRSKAYFNLGETLLALNDLNQAIRLAPANSDYLHDRGLFFYESGQLEFAITDFDWAIGLLEGFANQDPRHAKIFVDRGKTYLQSGAPHQAANDARTALGVFETFLAPLTFDFRDQEVRNLKAHAHTLLGDALIELGNPIEAQKEYNLGLKN